METRATPGCDNQEGLDIKCRNFELCETSMPLENLGCRSGELCMNCDMLYSDWKNGQCGTGILEFNNEIECPICLELKRSIKFPNCSHYICLDDFKRMFYGEIRENEPSFPYCEEIENEYYEDQNNIKWEKDYPLIEKYNEQHNIWEDEYERKYNEEENLRKCPICRT